MSLIDGGSFSRNYTPGRAQGLFRRAAATLVAETSVSQSALVTHLRTGVAFKLSLRLLLFYLHPCTRWVCDELLWLLIFDLSCSFVSSNTRPPSSCIFVLALRTLTNFIWAPTVGFGHLAELLFGYLLVLYSSRLDLYMLQVVLWNTELH